MALVREHGEQLASCGDHAASPQIVIYRRLELHGRTDAVRYAVGAKITVASQG